jgi:hypothetical protein
MRASRFYPLVDIAVRLRLCAANCFDAMMVISTLADLRVPSEIRIVRSPLAVRDRPALHGVVLTSELRTAFDLGRRLEFTEAVVAIDAMLHKRVA